MKKRVFIALFGIFMFQFTVLGLSADSHYKVVGGPDKFYYGHISLTEARDDGENPVVLREGQTVPEVAILNLPLGPGDTIRTTDSRRCEVQFDSGTIVRLDFATELKIETILARSLSSSAHMSNILLGRGRIYIMYKEYDSSEMFQVLTANTAVKLHHNAVAMISAAGDGATDIQLKSGKAQALFGRSEDLTKDVDIKKLQRLIVQKDHQYQMADYIAGTDFETWNEEVNKNFLALHEGQSALPKPVRNLPKAVVNFANYHIQYGEWLWDEMYGYVWRPYYNDVYPWGTWAPYVYGRWGTMDNKLFWIPGEPWGWVPYHLGIWQWDKKKGWIWMPGSMFAPAWAMWDFFFGYYCWRPFGLWDWFYFGSNPYYYFTGYGFYNRGGGWEYNWQYYGTGYEAGIPGGTLKPALSKISKSQLKKSVSASLPMPKEIKSAYRLAVAALKKGDARAVESLNHVPRTLVFVKEKELNATKVHEKALTWDAVPKQGLRPNTARSYERRGDLTGEALNSFRTLEGMKTGPNQLKSRVSAPAGEIIETPLDVRGDAAGMRARSGEAVARPWRGGIRLGQAQSAVRFRDWNPDIRVAHRLGVRIDYSSRTNEVVCPQLKLTSREVTGSRVRMTSRGIDQGLPGSSFSDPGYGSRSSDSSVNTRGETPPAHSSPPPRQEERTGGEKTKKD